MIIKVVTLYMKKTKMKGGCNVVKGDSFVGGDRLLI